MWQCLRTFILLALTHVHVHTINGLCFWGIALSWHSQICLFLFGTYTQSTDMCDIQMTFHIPDINQSIFLMCCTQITFCIVRETSTFEFFFFYARHLHDIPLVHVYEDLLYLRTYLYLKTLVQLKDFSVSKANQYTCLTYCTFVIHIDFLWQTSQTDLFIRHTQEQHNLYHTHPSSKSWTMTNLCLGSLTSRPDKREVASSDKVRGNLTCWSKISSNKMSWSRL